MRKQGRGVCLTNASAQFFFFCKYPILQNYVYKTLEVERHKTEFIKGPQLQKKEEQSL